MTISRVHVCSVTSSTALSSGKSRGSTGTMIGETGKPARLFVSHSHQPEDLAWCQTFVEALRTAGLDVWFDDQNLGYGALGDVIERELRARDVFVVVLSPAA